MFLTPDQLEALTDAARALYYPTEEAVGLSVLSWAGIPTQAAPRLRLQGRRGNNLLGSSPIYGPLFPI